MRLKISLIAFVVLLIIISGIFFFRKERAKPILPSTQTITKNSPTTSIREGYEQYSDSTYGISFEYPIKWGSVVRNPKQPENIYMPIRYDLGFSGNDKIGLILKGDIPWWLYDKAFESLNPSQRKNLSDQIYADDEKTITNSNIGDDCSISLKSREWSQNSKESCKIVSIKNSKAIERYLHGGSLIGSLYIKMYTFYSGDKRIDAYLILHMDIQGVGSNENLEQYTNLLEKTRNKTVPQSVIIAVSEFDEFVQSIRFQ